MPNPDNAWNAVPVELITATRKEEPLLANLLELYTHELSPLFGLELPENGRFGYANLPLYWTDPLRYPLLIGASGENVGFALVCRTSGVRSEAEVWDMAEFFVIPGFRNRGIGTRAAHEVWRRFPGPWQIRVLGSHVAGFGFWDRAARAYAPDRLNVETFDSNGKAWNVLTF